jgi:site-specific DNA-methyltransferase (adenine-specific)
MNTDLIIKGDARNMRDDLHRFRKYSLIAADCPWFYNDQKKVRKDGKTPTRGIGANHHYSLLKTLDLCAMPVKEVAADRCLLAMWSTGPHLPDALQVMEAWGFKYLTIGFRWNKVNVGAWKDIEDEFTSAAFLMHSPRARAEEIMERLFFFGPGSYTGSNEELVLFGRKGQAMHHAEGRKASQIILAPRDRAHSKKPEKMQNRLMWMYGHLLKEWGTHALEIFARRPRLGWDVYGNEPEKFGLYDGSEL